MAGEKLLPCDWLWARDQIKRARWKDEGARLMGNTRLVVSNESPTAEWETDETVYAVRYWRTEVVRYYPNGVVGASLNGWDTVTTKRRISRYSPFSIWSHRKGHTASLGSRNIRWAGDEGTWFHAKGDRMVTLDGELLPRLVSARSKIQVPRSRDTLAGPKEGDAFRDEAGMWVVAKDISLYPYVLKLFAYHGDHAEDRSECVTDATPSRSLPNALGLLASAHTGGLEPMNRFVWEAPA
jgi:hypothetical protein